MNHRSKGDENKLEGVNVLGMTQPERTRHGGHINTPLMSHENKCMCPRGRTECIRCAFRLSNLWFSSKKTRQVALSPESVDSDLKNAPATSSIVSLSLKIIIHINKTGFLATKNKCKKKKNMKKSEESKVPPRRHLGEKLKIGFTH